MTRSMSIFTHYIRRIKGVTYSKKNVHFLKYNSITCSGQNRYSIPIPICAL